MTSSPNGFLSWLGDGVLIVLALALGLRTQDPLAAAGILAGCSLLSASARRLDPLRYGPALVQVLGGSALLVATALWIHFGGRWLWTFPFLWAGYRTALLGLAHSRALRRNPPALLVLLALSLYALAFLGPWLLHSASAGGPDRYALDIRAGLHGVKAFLSIKSWWVALYVALLMMIAAILKKSRWSFLYVGSLFLLGIAAAVAWQPSLETRLVDLFGASPATLCEQFIAYSLQRFGAAGQGVMILAAAAALVLWPAYVESLNLHQAVQEANLLRGVMRTADARQLAQTVRGVTPVSLLAWIAQRGAWAALVISLWMALSRLHAAGKILPHQKLADLTMPQGHVLWDPWNALAAGLLGGVFVFLMVLKKAHGQEDPRLKFGWLIVLGAPAVGLFVPSGVVLFLLCFTTAWLFGLTLLFEPYAPPAVRPNPPEPPPPQRFQAPRPSETPSPATPKPEPEPEAPRDAPLFHLGAPVVSLTRSQGGGVYSLDDRGRVFHDQKELPFLKILDPLACATAGDGNLLVIDRNGTIRISPLQDGNPAPPQEHTAAAAIRGHAVNPFGTILAMCGPRSREIRGLWIASKKEQVLGECPGDPVTLGFSADNRLLAAGDTEGRIHLLSMSARAWEGHLDATVMEESSPVEQIQALAEGGWLVRYRHAVAVWDAAGKLMQAVRPNGLLATMACHGPTHRIAFGYEEGLVSTTTPEMRIIRSHGILHRGRVTALAFHGDGEALLSAGSDGTVHRIEL